MDDSPTENPLCRQRGGSPCELTAGSDDPVKRDQPKITDFDNFLPWACRQYSVKKEVQVIRTNQEVYVSVTTGQKKSARSPKKTRAVQAMMRSEMGSDDTEDKSEKRSSLESPTSRDNIIWVETTYDNTENLVQLKFLRNMSIPRKVMKLIALAIPYHKHLASITINSGLRMATLHEISKFLPISSITELCLDGTFLPEANYHTLLTDSKLKHLSLAKCSITDIVVKTITDLLVLPHPATKVLSALNLSSNKITDVGAKYVADMLRSNRQLSYLNLAGNMIRDEGCICILNSLQKFRLEPQEILDCRARYVNFLKEKRDLVNTWIAELQIRGDKTTKRKTGKKAKQDARESMQTVPQKSVKLAEIDGQNIQDKATALAETEMGSFIDPFSPKNTESQNGETYCFGNNTLCWLNLAYNKLTYISVKKLLDVLQMQVSLDRTRGLIKVVFEGNPMPVTCAEYEEIGRILEVKLVGLRKPIMTGPKKVANSKLHMSTISTPK